ncbi:MAG: hypothetical protein ABIZ30_10175 [Candidatus Limnocylindrales bacterium]
MVRRADDRRATFSGLLVAAGFLALATASIGLTLVRGGGGAWPAVHLVLAGAAGTAVASVLPFFTAALAQVAPAAVGIRLGAIALVAGGTLAVTVGVSAGIGPLAVLGGCAYLGGLSLVAVAVFLPLRTALGRRSGLVPFAYGFALAQVAIGVSLATAMVAGWAPVVANWSALKPAHAWLNVFGFLSVVVAATLLHLAPTVAGTRIRPRRSATLALVALMAGAPLVAIGFAGGWDAIARIGALTELVGSAALLVHASGVQRDRGRWTSDLGWHRFAGFSLLAAPAWFLVAMSIAAGRILWFGATPGAWSVEAIGVPLVLGWTAQVLIGAWTHLVPAIGPGNQLAHAAQRRRLGRWGTVRVLTWNGGVAILTVGLLVEIDAVAAVGAFAFGLSLVVALGLLIGSIPRAVARRVAVPVR